MFSVVHLHDLRDKAEGPFADFEIAQATSKHRDRRKDALSAFRAPDLEPALKPLREAMIRGRKMVGVAGFEPTTPCPPDKCANRAALHSD